MSTEKYQISDEVLTRISKSIKKIGLAQVEIANKIGIPPTRISDMLAKRYRVSFQLLEGLRKHFGISIDSIITGREHERRTYQRRLSDREGEIIDRRKNGQFK